VRVAGELDAATAPRLQGELDTLLESGHRELDVDLDEVSFCDVAGLNVLLHARAAALAAGGRFSLHGNCPTLRMMLRVLRLERVFEPIRQDGQPAGDEA
jgi:anti-anti-sigma factor